MSERNSFERFRTSGAVVAMARLGAGRVADAVQVVQRADEELALDRDRTGKATVAEIVLSDPLVLVCGAEDVHHAVLVGNVDQLAHQQRRGAEISAQAFLPDDAAGGRPVAGGDSAVVD